MNKKNIIFIIALIVMVVAIAFPWEQPKPQFQYIHTIDWPPSVDIIEMPFICTEGGEPTDRAGQTKLREIAGREYCVSEVTEGAAGSIYTQYYYNLERSRGRVEMKTFSLRFEQCANYDEPAKSECAREQQEFNPDEIMLGTYRY